MDVVLRDAELLEVAANRSPGDAGLAQATRRSRPAARFASFLPSSPRIRPWWTNSGGVGAERLEQPTVQLLVRPVVEAADDVRDPEVDVVDDAREVIRRGSVLAQQRDPVEAVAELRRRPRGSAPAARSGGPALRPTTSPSHSGRRMSSSSPPGTFRCGSVSSIRSSIQSPSPPVGDSAERVPDMQGTGRARCETHALHRPPSLVSSRRGSVPAT